MTVNKALDLVYAAKNEQELAAGYAAWAAGYDRETAELGYCLPFVITSWLARYVPAGEGPLLDAGCGTGLTGPYAKALGYDDIEGLDLSEEMLEVARGRNAYKTLKKAALGERLPWPDDYFRAFFASGVFTEGHAPASAFDDLVRITAKGGHAMFTIRESIIERDGFQDRFNALAASGKWRLVEETPSFRPYAIAEPEIGVKVFVFEIL